MTTSKKPARFQPFAASYIVLFDGAKVLLSRRFNTGWMDGHYSLPAGHIDEHETASECIIREAKEEIGVEIGKEDLSFLAAMHRKSDKIYIDFFFVAQKWQGEPKICETDKCDGLLWADLNDLPENIIPSVRVALDSLSTGDSYLEVGWDEEISG